MKSETNKVEQQRETEIVSKYSKTGKHHKSN